MIDPSDDLIITDTPSGAGFYKKRIKRTSSLIIEITR